MKKNTNANLPVLIFMLALLIIWQAGAMGMNAAYILPSPTQILVRLWELRKPLFTAHLPATMLCTGVGLAISVALGLLLAIVMDASPAAERMLYPLIIASQTIPTTALAPLFVLWFGYTIWSKVLVTVLITFFPIAMTVFDGFRSAKTDMAHVRRRPKGDIPEAEAAGGTAVFLLSHKDGNPDVDHRRCDRRMAWRAGGPRIFQPPHDDAARRRRCFRADRSAERSRNDCGRHRQLARKEDCDLEKQPVTTLGALC